MHKSHNKFWFDVETTGLDYNKHEIIQIAYMIEIDNEIKLTRKLYVKPNLLENIDTKALEINNTKLEDFDSDNYITQQAAYNTIVADLQTYNLYNDYYQRFVLCGYNNAEFDNHFLRKLFGDNQNFFRFFKNIKIDVFVLLTLLEQSLNINFKSFKLSDVAAVFNIPINAHDSMSDIKATYYLYKLILKRFNLT